MLKKFKVLVAGGAGFVGSHLCEQLLRDGHQVLCVDNFQTGRRSTIANIADHSNFELIQHDITNPINLTVDRIYNLACAASPPRYQADPIHTLKTSVLGSIHLLDLALAQNARILQASTSEVYGDPHVHPQPESYWGHVNPIGIRSCYDEGKRAAETLFFDYHRVHHVDIRVVRIFNTYGPQMDPNDGRVVSNLVVQALTNKDLTLFGDGMQTRSFQYVSDLVAGMIAMMENTSGFIGPVNLGNPGEFTMQELAEKVLKAIPESRSKIVFRPLPADDPRQRKPVITLAKEKLDWRPRVSLDDGLERTIAYFRQCCV